MSIFLTIIAFAVIFSVLILIHEYGHFIAARRAGIKVLEFGFGFPPRIFKKKVGETVYSINAIPFGGFVKLYGEDPSDIKTAHEKESFSHKSPWIRTKVTIAGVFMNFVLAIVLLTIGFSFGIEPLLVTEQDLFNNLENGNVVSAPGSYISSVNDAAKASGAAAGDQILAIDDKPVTSAEQLAIFEKGTRKKDIDLTLRHSKGAVARIHLPFAGKDYGVTLKSYTDFPRLSILAVKPNSPSDKAGVKPHDVILRMNGANIFTPADFENAIYAGTSTMKYAVLRGTSVLQIPVVFADSGKVVLADVFADSAAQKAGFQKGDIVLSINNESVSNPEQVQKILKQNTDKEMIYKIDRNGSQMEIKARTDANKMLGVNLSSAVSYKNEDLSFYRDNVLTSIVEIKNVRYSPLIAFGKAITETVRLTGLTVVAFGKTLASVFSKFTVPADIGGPVQIAYYTHTFVQEGFFALLRFTALLSVSLAVINILPIPALDGGRLLFVLIEVIARKRVNARIESIVHGIGFILLLILIALVTFSDITKLI